MSADEFVKSLLNVPFPKESYEELGLSDDFIKRTFSRYLLIPKVTVKVDTKVSLLANIINNYEVSNFEIGAIGLRSEIEEIGEFIYVGNFEIDILAISKISKGVVILSCEAPHPVIYYCAYNESNFFEALITAAKFLETCVVDESVYLNSEIRQAVIESCTNLAGGSKYLNFYRVLLGG